MTTHLEELMEDVNLYSWEKVKAFNAGWLNQLEQKCTDWSNRQARMKLKRALVLPPTSTIKASGMGTAGGMAPINTASTYGAPTKPGTKTCRAFNDGMCLKAQDHHQWQHMCAFCLKTTNRAYQHSKTSCNRKKFQSQPKKRLRGVVTHSLSPDHGVFALSQMDAPGEKLDLPMDTKLTTLPTPHPRGGHF